MIYRRVFSALILFVTMAPLASYAGQATIDIAPRTSTPGSTVVLSGKGLGQFKSVQFNKVTFAGVPALIQRWESDLVEVKVPFKAVTGPVEMVIGKKKLAAGTFTVVKPRIESITPTEAERGTMVTITGEHFGATAGARDPNTMFGVNDVVIGGGGDAPAASGPQERSGKGRGRGKTTNCSGLGRLLHSAVSLSWPAPTPSSNPFFRNPHTHGQPQPHS